MSNIYAPMTALPVRLPQELRAKLIELSARDNVAQQVHIRLALAEYLDRKLAALPKQRAKRAPARAKTAPPADNAPILAPAQAKALARKPRTPRQPSAAQRSPAATSPASPSGPTPNPPSTTRARRPRQATPTFR